MNARGAGNSAALFYGSIRTHICNKFLSFRAPPHISCFSESPRPITPHPLHPEAVHVSRIHRANAAVRINYSCAKKRLGAPGVNKYSAPKTRRPSIIALLVRALNSLSQAACSTCAGQLLSARTGSEFLTPPRAFAILYKFVKCFSLSHLSNKKTVSIYFVFLLR
jgi:hypothetical protein